MVLEAINFSVFIIIVQDHIFGFSIDSSLQNF